MFDESKHPRDDDGKFTDGNGDSSALKHAESVVKNYENNAGTIWFDKNTGESHTKKIQLDIINATNPAPDTYHT